MRVFALAIVFSLSILTFNASAQEMETTYLPKYEESRHIFGFRLDPIWTFIGGMGAEADVRVSQSVSIGLGGYYIFPRNNSTDLYEDSDAYKYKWSAYEIWLGPTVMLTGDYDHRGFYIAPGVGFTGAKVSTEGSSSLTGSLDAPELRLTVGYQWVVQHFRFTTGAGMRLVNSTDVVVRDESGNEVVSQNSSSLGGLALDLGVGLIF